MAVPSSFRKYLPNKTTLPTQGPATPPVLTRQDYAAGIPALDDLLDINASYAFEDPYSSQSQNESADEDDTERRDILQPVKTPENPQKKDQPMVEDRQDETNRPDTLQRAISEAELNNDDLQDHWGDEVEEHEYELVFPKPIIDPVSSNHTDS